jgi:hypothetical protein
MRGTIAAAVLGLTVLLYRDAQMIGTLAGTQLAAPSKLWAGRSRVHYRCSRWLNTGRPVPFTNISEPETRACS